MIEADAPSTEEVVSVSCARPTGGRHGLTTGDYTQRFEGAKLRPRYKTMGKSAAGEEGANPMGRRIRPTSGATVRSG
jgi:hypothetical protein